MADELSLELLERWRQGDQDAATEIFDRYAARLIALAGSRLSEKLARRVDSEDVVYSACRSFFLGARAGQFNLERSGDLWKLLVRITLRKLYRQAERHGAQKRGMGQEREAHAEDSSGGQANFDPTGGEPTPLEAAALADEMQLLMAGLEPRHRDILEKRLQGCKIDEIADELTCSERTVRRVLDHVKELLEKRDVNGLN